MSIPADVKTRPKGRWLLLAVYLCVFGVVMLVWQHPDLRRWLDPQALSQLGRELLALPAGPVVVLGGYVVAVVLAMPVALLMTAGVLIFGPWPGVAYAMVGMVSGAVVTYGIGRLTGARLVDRLADHRLLAFSRALQRRGLWAIVFVRAFPVAPFLMVNLAAGALRVPVRHYVIGSFIGLLPGTVVIALFMDRLAAVLEDPGPGTYATLAAVLTVVAVAGWLLRRRLRQGAALA